MPEKQRTYQLSLSEGTWRNKRHRTY